MTPSSLKVDHVAMHLAFLEADADRFAQAALVEGKKPTENKDESRSFYTQGLKGFALEWVWRP